MKSHGPTYFWSIACRTLWGTDFKRGKEYDLYSNQTSICTIYVYRSSLYDKSSKKNSPSFQDYKYICDEFNSTRRFANTQG